VNDSRLSRPTLIAAVVTALLAAAILAIGLVRWPGAPGPRTAVPLTPAAAAELVSLKSTALGHLEAGRYQEAEAAFAVLLERLPEDPLAARNLTIGRLLAAQQAGAETRTEALGRARAALERLRALAPDAAPTHLLAARLEKLAGNDAEAVAALARAVELAPDARGLWYELYTLARHLPDSDRARAALARAHALASDNLSVLIDRLAEQAKSSDPALPDTLDAAAEVLEPFTDSIRFASGVDLEALVEQAAEAVRRDDWGEARGAVMRLANVLRAEVATRLDRRRLLRHELEYALERLDPAVEALARGALPEAEAIPVRLELEKAPLAGGDRADVQAFALDDFDLDGRLELALARGRRLEIRTLASGGSTLLAAAELPMAASGVVGVDLDRDSEESPQDPLACQTADLDLVAFGPEGLVVIENRWSAERARRALAPRPEAAPGPVRGVSAVAPADVDHDGDLDLVIATGEGVRVWANRGDGTFLDISDRSALAPAATALVPVDWNRTVDIDVLLARGGTGPPGYLENHRHGRFRQRALEGFEALAGASALAVDDFDGNVSWDVAAAGASGVAVATTRTAGPGRVTAIAERRLSGAATAGVGTWDYDNDGYRDLIAWGDEGLAAWRGGPGAELARVESLFPATSAKIDDARVADLDGDGDEDVAVLSKGRVHWYRNQGGNANGWLDVALSGQRRADQKDERVNIHGIGSVLEVRAGPLYQARVVSGPSMHFGLGARERANIARVLWTNGIPQVVMAPQSGQSICQVQILKGSCPYLYTWTGERFEFMTDLLWSAPLGLRLSETEVAPAREWEYLTIPGERLAARDGEYHLRVTEELWEVAYFDQLALIAVDHPRGVDVYSNEKVGPAEVAPFRLHTVRDPRTPVAARDGRGRDVLDLVAREDGRHLKGFTARKVQGLVDEHALELDLGALDAPRSVTLFLTGWTLPSDSSLNVAVSQHPALEAPRPPSLAVPDGRGGWREALPYMGFPGGKTKTIAVDLSGRFPAADYRVRIATTMEIYWEHVFFTVDEAPAPLELRRLPLRAAELRPRGFSARIEPSGHGPESYDYERVSSAPRWPPIEGRFTPYGDVTGAAGAAGGRLVTLAPGDELALRFEAPPPPRPGWTRDFILHNVGWDKDADLNTVHGSSVAPSPTGGAARARQWSEAQGPEAQGPEAQAEPGAAPGRVMDGLAFWRFVRDLRLPAEQAQRVR